MSKIITPKKNVDSGVSPPVLFAEKLMAHFQVLYGDEIARLSLPRVEALIQTYFPDKAGVLQQQVYRPHQPDWTEKDTLLISYADMIRAGEEGLAGEEGQVGDDSNASSLRHLHEFLTKRLAGKISTVHLLPFFPSSSDDGFSVIDYKMMDSGTGRWEELEQMSSDFRIMGDLVMNHVSQHSAWFQGYLRGDRRYRDYFLAMSPDADLCDVVRPRSHPLLTRFETAEGESWIWTTFSEDQVDVNYANPEVLFEYIDTLFFYLSKGVTMVRMDAVAFIWKEPGTTCLHHRKTHEIVKLIRALTDAVAPGTTLITETNVPHAENISYFGDGDEAHMVYQFSLAPLLLHALRSGSSRVLSEWLKGVSDLPDHALFLNFTASHDGIGVRPAEGLVPQEEMQQLIEEVKELGGFLSSKRNSDGSLSPYELNITYFDALGLMGEPEEGWNSGEGRSGSAGTLGGERDMGHGDLISQQIARFVCSQAVVLGLKGVPALYFQSLIAGKNDLQGVEKTGRYRSINRKRWRPKELEQILSDSAGSGKRVFDAIQRLLEIRQGIPAFHPMGEQHVVDLGDPFLSWIRVSPDGKSCVWVVANLTGRTVTISPFSDLQQRTLRDAISGEVLFSNGRGIARPYQVLWLELPVAKG